MRRTRPWITAGVALAGAGVVAITPATVVLPDVHGPAAQAFDIQLTAADIVLDLVRHGESTENVTGFIGTTAPGAHLSDAGQLQADAVAPLIHAAFPGGIDGIYSSDFYRAQETAAPLASLLGMDVTHLSGLGEINAGMFEGETGTLPGLLYLMPTISWMFGQYWVPMLGSDINPNGMAFQDNYGDAIQTIYNTSVADPDSTGTDVAFSHGAAIAAWTMMNVKNPDFGLFFKTLLDDHGLPNTSQVVLEGNPTDGWTLVSWNGEAVDAQPDLLTGLFVDFRDLMVAPQMASWHIMEALQGGDSADITAALQTGFSDVLAAYAAFPQSVIDTITGAMGDATGGGALATGDIFGDMLSSLAS